MKCQSFYKAKPLYLIYNIVITAAADQDWLSVWHTADLGKIPRNKKKYLEGKCAQ